MTTATYRDFTGPAAEIYEKHFVPAIATPASDELLKTAELQPGERVLDVACGTGVVSRLAATAVGGDGAVTAVDVAPDMLAVAAAIDRPVGAPIEWLQADAVSMPLPGTFYDVVLCQMGLMFVEDRAAAVAEMFRVLKPNGRVVINTPGRIQPPFEEMERAIVEHINPALGGFVRAVFSMHDSAVLGALLTEAGFVDVEAAEIVSEFDLPSPAEFLWQYINLTPMAGLVAEAPKEAKAAMQAQVIETWAPFVVDGRVPLAQPMALAWGRRH